MGADEKSKTWEWLHRGGTLASYGTVLSFVGGIAVGAWAYVSQLPAPTIAAHGVVTAAALLGIVAALRVFFRRDGTESKPGTQGVKRSEADEKLVSQLHDIAAQRKERLEAAEKSLADTNAKWSRKLEKARHDVTQAEGLASMYRQERDQLVDEAKAWSERLAFAGEELKKAQAETADVRQALGREATQLSLALQEANDRSRDWCWQARYGVEYPSNIPDRSNDLHTLVAMRPRFDEHIGVCKEVSKRTEVILAWIVGNMKNSNNQDAKEWLGRFLEEYVWERFARVTAMLEESREDPRAALVAFYSRYEPARRWIGHGLPLVIKVEKDGLDPNWGRAIDYQEWLEADAAFMADVKRLQSVTYLQPVMKHLPEGLYQWLPIPLKGSAPA